MMDYHRQNNVDIRIARIFNTYGPRMQENDGRVVSNFIVQALSDNRITIYGDGNQTRSFCYVEETVDGLIRLMNAAAFHEPVNLGNPSEFTINELAERGACAIPTPKLSTGHCPPTIHASGNRILRARGNFLGGSRPWLCMMVWAQQLTPSLNEWAKL